MIEMKVIKRHTPQVLGVNPIEGFDMVKAAYTRKRRDAERRGDEATAALVCPISLFFVLSFCSN